MLKPPTIEELTTAHTIDDWTAENKLFVSLTKKSAGRYVRDEVASWSHKNDEGDWDVPAEDACAVFVLGIEIGMRIMQARVVANVADETNGEPKA